MGSGGKGWDTFLVTHPFPFLKLVYTGAGKGGVGFYMLPERCKMEAAMCAFLEPSKERLEALASSLRTADPGQRILKVGGCLEKWPGPGDIGE